MQNIFLFISTFLAYLVKAITGFGNTLVMGSLFSFVVSNKVTTPIDLIFSLPTNLFIVWKERRNISLRLVIPLSMMLLLGVIPGTFLLKTGSDWLLKSILGLVIIGIAIEMWTRKSTAQTNKKSHPIFLAAIGILSGMLVGMYGIGALLVAYISRTTENRSQFRANICCIFLVDNLFRFFLYWYSGILNKEIISLALILTPAVVLGMAAGFKVDSRLNDATVKKAVIALLIISGAILFVKSFLFR